MKAIKLILLSIVFALITFSCNKERIDTPDVCLNPSAYYEALNISYDPDTNQKIDLYLPANRSSSKKTIILVRGGVWSEANEADMNGIPDVNLNGFA